MSINLVFVHTKGVMRGDYVEFPVQTQTEFTRKVLAEPDSAARLNLIIDYVLDNTEGRIEDKLDLLIRIKRLMSEDTLALTYC